MTLHDAIKQVLIDSKKPMTAAEIAGIINSGALYNRGDNNPVPSSQISARVNNYPELFEKKGKLISLFHFEEVQIQLALRKVLDSLRGELIHGSDSFSNVLSIPMCFFFKRVLDNADLSENIFHEKLQIAYNYDGFLQFLGLLEETYPDLKSILPDLASELNKQRNTNLEKLLTDLADTDLRRTHLPDKIFSELYINIIGIVAKRDFNLGLFSTPDTLAELIAGLASLYPFKSLYNPGAGIGTLPAVIRRNNPNEEFFFTGEEINPYTYLLAFTNLVINSINIIDFRLKDSLLNPLKMKFDLIVCNPPVNAVLPNKHGWPELGNTNKSHLVFLGSVLSKLKSKGRAIILMPEGFLFSQESIEKNYKRYLLNNALIEGIISLPAGLFLPLSGIKTSLLILNSRKVNEFTYLIDAENLNLQNRPEKNEINLETEKIINIILSSLKDVSRHEMEDQLAEPRPYYNSDYFAVKNLNPADLNLSVKRYLVEDNPDLDTKNWFRLVDIFNYYWQSTKGHDTKYINTSGLNVNYFDYRLDLSKQPNETKPGSYLDQEAVLIGSIAGNYKPSYFDGSEPVVVSQSIHVLTFKPAFENKVLTEYVIYELAGKSFTDKLDRLSTGSTSLKRVSKADLLNARIYIPSIEEQETIINVRKEAIITSRINEVSDLSTKLGLAEKSDYRYLGFVQHEYNNIAGGITNYIITLKSLLQSQSIDNNTKLSGRKNSPTVYEALNAIENNIGGITDLFESIKIVLSISGAKLNVQDTSFRSIISACFTNLLGTNEDFLIFTGIDQNYNSIEDVLIPIDSKLFTILISNFIVNSIKHGYEAEDINKILVFNLTQDDDFCYLNMINNGKSLPEDFSSEDFIQFGKRAGTTKGSGLGGFIMNEIVRKHGGSLSIIPFKEMVQISSENESLVVNKGIHFQIQLPKNK